MRPRPIATVREVVRTDLAAFLAVYALFLFWVMMLVLSVYSQQRTLPAQAPLYPVYILAGTVTALCFWSVKVRFDRVNAVLAKGWRVTATVDHFFVAQVYAEASLSYQVGGDTVHVKLWLPATKITRQLANLEQVVLFLPSSATLKPVIGNFYTTRTV